MNDEIPDEQYENPMESEYPLWQWAFFLLVFGLLKMKKDLKELFGCKTLE